MVLKNLYLIVGKSGTGKTTIVDNLSPIGVSIESYTTRPPRYKGELGHVFVSKEEFDKLDVVSYTEYNGYEYGITPDQIESHTFFVVDPAGVFYLLDHYKGKKPIHTIYLKTSLPERFARLVKRDGFKNAVKRILIDRKAFKGFEWWADLVVKNNEDYRVAAGKIRDYIRKAEFGRNKLE